MTTITDRERALVKAARALDERGFGSHALVKALSAYDLPKTKVYVLPEFGQLDTAQRMVIYSVLDDHLLGGKTSEQVYNAIRELTAKEQE